MNKKLMIACCGGWHSHAKDFPMDRAARFCSDIPHEFAAVWDDDSARGTAWAAEMGCRFEPDYDALCADKSIDGFLITAGTTKHARLIIQAAEAGKHIFIEKALSVSPEEARRARDAVKKSGIHFTISDPVEKPELVYAKRRMDDGLFGEITELRYRVCHAFGLTDPALMARFYQKQEAGAGAMFDLGHHAVHVLLWFLGKPSGAMGIFPHFSETGKANAIDDTGTAIFSFPSGAVGVAECGWLCPGGQNIFELYGTRGFLRWDCDGLRWRFDEKSEWTRLSPAELPPPPAYPLRYWMESVYHDTPNTQYTIDEAVTVTEILAAAYRTDGKQELIQYR